MLRYDVNNFKENNVENEYKKMYGFVAYFSRTLELNKYFDYNIQETKIIRGNCESMEKTNSLEDQTHFVYFIKIIFDYFSRYPTHILNVSQSIKVDQNVQLSIINNVIDQYVFLSNPMKSNLFKMFYYLFAHFFKLLKTLDKQLIKNRKNEVYPNGTILTTFCTTLDLIFYLQFMEHFPDALKKEIHKKLYITKLEESIITRCGSLIHEKDGVCYKDCEKIPGTKECIRNPYIFIDEEIKRYKLTEAEGIQILVKIMSSIRKFNDTQIVCDIQVNIKEC